MPGYWMKVYSSFGASEAGAAVLAFVTTIHCALFVLRKHRSHPKGKASLILFPSFIFAATPWFLATPLWLLVVLASHVAWFVACEKLVPVAVASASSAATSSAPSAAPEPPPEVAESPSEDESASFSDGCALEIKLQRRGKVVTVQSGQSILEAAEAAGEDLPSICRAGACGTCRMRVIEGEVDGDFDLIDEKERAEGYILSCVARPVENCGVDA